MFLSTTSSTLLTVFAIAHIASVGAADSSSAVVLPNCAQACFSSAAALSTCPDNTPKCICTDNVFITGVANCIVPVCSASDVQLTEQYATLLCRTIAGINPGPQIAAAVAAASASSLAAASPSTTAESATTDAAAASTPTEVATSPAEVASATSSSVASEAAPTSAISSAASSSASVSDISATLPVSMPMSTLPRSSSSDATPIKGFKGRVMVTLGVVTASVAAAVLLVL
ncbi:hypothetical protein PYCC9005_002673 [Savitreella phatthalungensis]